MARKRLGELLLERGVIDEDQLASALAYQRQWGHRLGSALVAKGFVSEARLCTVLGEALGIPVVDLSKHPADPRAARLLDQRLCQSHELVPIALSTQGNRKILTCAMTDPMDMAVVDEIEFTADCKVRPVLAPLTQIRAVQQQLYRGMRVKIPSFEETERKIPERMEIIHADGTGGHEVVTLEAEPVSPPAPAPEAPIRGEEITDRTALAEIIREHEAIVQQRSSRAGLQSDLDYLFGVNDQDAQRLETLERNFWTLMRLLAKKGVITRPEFETEFRRE